MPAEIALSDGTKLVVEETAAKITDELQRMAYHGDGSVASAGYGDWVKYPGGLWFNPAQVVYVQDVEPPATPVFDILG